MAGSAVPPGVIADAVAAARAYLRLANDDEDAVLTRAAAAAIGLAEGYCRRELVRRGFEDLRVSTGGWLKLGAGPVASIAGIVLVPVGAAPSPLPVEEYGFDIDGDGAGWVRVFRPGLRVAIIYQAGEAADWAGLAPPVAQGIAMLAAHLFDDRTQASAPPAAIAALWRPYRTMRLRVERRA